RRSGVDVVLSGGACVSIYAREAYLSYDLDFVLVSYTPRAKLREAMARLGFSEDGRHFRHPETPFIVEFLSPPLSVGEEPVRNIAEITKRNKTLRLLSPTDCVKDRLAAYYHWNDRSSLEQAALVARNQKVDLKEIRRWSNKEGMTDKLAVFLRALNKRRPGS
ncbi:MAG: hypothetical protein OEW18_05620, partial [Candidatus Aminicenantes bacterium]|nr:hypothetical protein [Candidatus Aminicenantes bacterium]